MQKLFRFTLHLGYISLILLTFSISARAQTIVCLESTVLGDVCMELLETEAPVTAANFLEYVERGSYHRSFFHLGVNDGPIYAQAGKYVHNGAAGLEGFQEISTKPPIVNEASISNTRGTIAMVPDDPNDPDSATSQFLINLADNSSTLDNENGGYTVFARILGEGTASVDFISSLDIADIDDDGLSSVPVITLGNPVESSIRIVISDVVIFPGDITDFEQGSGSDGTGDNSDGGDTPTPGVEDTLFEGAVCVDTNVGEFCMKLLPNEAPATVNNFLSYINSSRYDDTIVHRSVPNFVIQGGGYNSNPLGSEIQRDAFVINEFGRSNIRGTVAMARLGGTVNSATSEWFVNVANNTQLDNVDGGFTVFAIIISGQSVVDAIAVLPRANLSNSLGGAFGEVPLSDQDTDGVGAEDTVLVHRIYVTDVTVTDSDSGSDSGDGGRNNDDISDDEIETTVRYSTQSSAFSMPVRINDVLYLVSMIQATQATGIVFSVNTTRIFTLVDNGQDAASMDLDTGVLLIPSVRVDNIIITDVEFNLINFGTLTFNLVGFSRS